MPQDLILSLHQNPENNYTGEQSRASLCGNLARGLRQGGGTSGYRILADRTQGAGENSADASAMLDQVSAPNLKLAVSAAMLAKGNASAGDVEKQIQGKLGMWMVGAPYSDATGNNWPFTMPLNGASAGASALKYTALSPNTPIALDAVYGNVDEEYLRREAHRGPRNATVTPPRCVR